MLCSIVSIVSQLLLQSSSDVRDVYCWVKASLRRRRLLSGRVVGREDGLLGLLADVHLELARDSLLLGHCGGCVGVVWMCMRERGACVSRAQSRCLSAQEATITWWWWWLKCRSDGEGRSGRGTSQERLRAACKNAVAGSGKRSLSERAQ